MKSIKIVQQLSMVMVLSMGSYAGGKLVTLALSPIVPIVVPSTPLYVGLGFVTAGLSRDCPCDPRGPRINDMTYGGLVRAGWDYNRYIGLEVRGIWAKLEKDFSETTHFGLFVKPQYPLTKSINLYALAGVGKTTVDYSNERCFKGSQLTKEGFSYGGGAEYAITDAWGLWIDYQHLLYNEGVFDSKSNIGTLGVRYTF